MSSVRRYWTDAEIEVLRWAYPDRPAAEVARMLGRTVKQVYAAAAHYQVRKSEAYMAAELQRQAARLRTANPATRFTPGHRTWNKGTKGVMGQHPNCRRTQFKPGSKPHNTHPIGHERLSKEGYLQRKVQDTGYTPRDYRPVHHLAWEQANRRAVPSGHAVCFINGDKRDFRPENLELVPRRELMRRNSYHTNLPPELRPIVQLRGAIARQINRRRGTKRGPNAKRASNP